MALRSAALAATAGVLIALGGAPLELSFPAFFAPACLLAALEPTPGRAVSAGRALAVGALAGSVAQAISMYWAVGLLVEFGHFPRALAVLTAALLWVGQSLPYASACAIAAVLLRAMALPDGPGAARHRPGAGRGWLILPACLVGCATLAPAIFPWRYGLSQLPFLPYAQVAELGGLPLLDWLVATVGCGALEALRHRRRGALLAALLAFGVPPAYGLVRLDAVREARAEAPLLRVGVVQPNVSIRDKHDPARFFSQLTDMRDATRALEAAGAELVLWPETAYRYPVHRDARHDREGPLGLLQDGVRGPLLVGVITSGGPTARAVARDHAGRPVDSFTMGTSARMNSAIAVARDGRIVGIADKVHLLAFGEHTPLWEWLPYRERIPRGLTPGRGPQIVTIAGARVLVLNCYEDLLGDYTRAQAESGPDFLANLTNNAWFGDTSAPHLHHMNARMRAIETRRDLVRAVNTGVSGHTAATGEDHARTEAFVRDAFVAEVRLLRGTSLYVALGDWVTPLSLGGLFGTVLALRVRRKRPATAP